MLNKNLVKRKISLIQEELVRLADFSKMSLNEIIRDFVKQAALERFLERIITRAIDVNQHLILELAQKETTPPKDYKETFLRLADFKIYPKDFAENISRSVGTRNILVHEYEKVDYSKIYGAVDECIRDYHRYCDYILEFIEKN